MDGYLCFQSKIVAIINNMRSYKKEFCITFRSTKDYYGGLSNMAPGFPVTINDIFIKNVESLYQSLKYPHNPEIQEKILNTNSPIFAKKISRHYSNFERSDWIKVRYKIMRLCLEIKLKQNTDKFAHVLLSTNDLPIVEYTKDDKVWGAVDKGDHYEGVNALGRLLMELREKYKKDPMNYSIDIPDIPNVYLLNIDLKTIL